MKSNMNSNRTKDRNLHISRNFLKEKIRRSNLLHNSFNERRIQILNILKRTVETGESDSALIVGPRGCGKTSLIRGILKELSEDELFSKNSVVVLLNGFVHIDDRMTIRDITRQLKFESLVENKEFKSVAENLSFLLESLKSGKKGQSKAIIFIIDEFDLFCTRQNQTLIYSLFDVAQIAQNPVCLLGLTACYDVLELLEERVKSRFSRRQFYLHNGAESGFKDRISLLSSLLKLPHRLHSVGVELNFINSWNKQITTILESKTLIDLLDQQYQINNSDTAFRNYLLQVVSRLSSKNKTLAVEDFIDEYTASLEDSKINMLIGLSVLELCLVIAMKHFTKVYNGDPFNFELILRSYIKFVHNNSSVLVTRRSVILKAFENLKVLEFIRLAEGEENEETSDTSNSRSKQIEFKMYYLLLTDEQIDSAVRSYTNLPTEVSQWAANTDY